MVIRAMVSEPRKSDVERLSELTGFFGDMPEFMAKMHLVLKGDFEKEIEALKALKDEIAEKHGIVDTMEKAGKLRQEADEYAASTRAEAKTVKEAALAENARAGEANAKARAWLAEIVDKEQKFSATAQAKRHELDAREAELARREDVNAKYAASLQRRETELAGRIEQHQAAVRALEQKAARLRAAMEG